MRWGIFPKPVYHSQKTMSIFKKAKVDVLIAKGYNLKGSES